MPLEVREAARAHTAAAIETLVEVMKDRKAPPSARVSAAEAVLNRGWGRQGVDALLDRNKETKDFGRRPMRSVDALLNIRDARTALQLAPRDEWAHWTMAGAYMDTGQLEDAVAECERSLEINPNFSNALARLGACFALLGRAEEAIEMCCLALQLNPRDPYNYWRHSYIALAHFVAVDYEAALQESKRVALSRPHLQSTIIWAAAAAALAKTEEARTAVERCLAQRSDLRVGSVVPDIMVLARGENHERPMALLRKAGLPE